MITPYPGGSADTGTQSGTQRQDLVPPPLCLPGWTLVFASPAPTLISGCRGTTEDDARNAYYRGRIEAGHFVRALPP